MLTVRATCGWSSPASRAHMDDDPTPTLRTTVGNSSAAYTYMMAKQPATAHFPSIRKVVSRVLRSVGEDWRLKLT